MNEFKTKNGRTVYDGGGIEPDIDIAPEKFSNITASLFSKYIIFNYATKFAHENAEIALATEFEITDNIFNDFVSYVEEQDFEYTTDCEKKLNALKKAAEKESYFSDVEEEFNALENALKANKEEDIKTFSDEIRQILEMEIVARYYYQKGRILSSLNDDPEIKEAIQILDDDMNYALILSGGEKM